MPKGKIRERELDEFGWVIFDLKPSDPPPQRDLLSKSLYGGMMKAIRDKLPVYEAGTDPSWFQISGAWDDSEAAHAVAAIRDYFHRSEYKEVRVELIRRGSKIFVRKFKKLPEDHVE